MLYTTADCASPPAAKLQSNVFGTHYELVLDPSVSPFEGPHARDAEGRLFGKSGSLMDVQYKTRLKGFMRPRRCPSLLRPLACPPHPSAQRSQPVMPHAAPALMDGASHSCLCLRFGNASPGCALSCRPRCRMRVGLPKASALDRFSSREGLAADRREAASLQEAADVHASFPSGARGLRGELTIRTDAPCLSPGEQPITKFLSCEATHLVQHWHMQEE